MWREQSGIFRRRQRRTAPTLGAVSLGRGQGGAAGELQLAPGSLPSLGDLVLLAVPRVTDGHRQGQALLDGPPLPGIVLLCILLLFLVLLEGKTPSAVLTKETKQCLRDRTDPREHWY